MTSVEVHQPCFIKQFQGTRAIASGDRAGGSSCVPPCLEPLLAALDVHCVLHLQILELFIGDGTRCKVMDPAGDDGMDE